MGRNDACAYNKIFLHLLRGYVLSKILLYRISGLW
jgi:hypothetical protein